MPTRLLPLPLLIPVFFLSLAFAAVSPAARANDFLTPTVLPPDNTQMSDKLTSSGDQAVFSIAPAAGTDSIIVRVTNPGGGIRPLLSIYADPNTLIDQADLSSMDTSSTYLYLAVTTPPTPFYAVVTDTRSDPFATSGTFTISAGEPVLTESHVRSRFIRPIQWQMTLNPQFVSRDSSRLIGEFNANSTEIDLMQNGITFTLGGKVSREMRPEFFSQINDTRFTYRKDSNNASFSINKNMSSRCQFRLDFQSELLEELKGMRTVSLAIDSGNYHTTATMTCRFIGLNGISGSFYNEAFDKTGQPELYVDSMVVTKKATASSAISDDSAATSAPGKDTITLIAHYSGLPYFTPERDNFGVQLSIDNIQLVIAPDGWSRILRGSVYYAQGTNEDGSKYALTVDMIHHTIQMNLSKLSLGTQTIDNTITVSAGGFTIADKIVLWHTIRGKTNVWRY